MGLGPEDESPHAAPEAVAGWQENCFLMGWDDRAGAGFYFHVERLPDRGHQEVKACVVSRDEVIAAVEERPLDDGFAGVSVRRPFELLDVVFAGRGRSRPGRTGFVPDDAGEDHVPLVIDVALEAECGPVDWSELLAHMGVEGTERNHYEQGLRWTGVVRAGRRELQCRGLAVRDHTWGARQYDGFDYAWWTPTAFNDGSFVTGVSLKLGDAWVGGSFRAKDGAVEVFPVHRVDTDGQHVPAGYDRATVTAGGCTFGADVITHVPVRYPGFGLPFVSSEGFAVATTADGRTGFSTVEINGPF